MSKVENSKELQDNKERDLHFSFFEEMNIVKKEHRRMIDIIKQISFKRYNQKEIGNIIDEIVFEFDKLDNERVVNQINAEGGV